MNSEHLLIDLAWRELRYWRLRRDVDPPTRRPALMTGGAIHSVELRAGIGGRT